MHNKRILAVFIILLFCATLAVGGSAVFKVSEVNASYELLSSEQESQAKSAGKELDGFIGKNIVFLKQSEITKVLSKYTYLKLESVKKIYPNTLALKISERTELFALKSGQNFFMLDKGGFVLSQKTTNLNNIDGYKNIVIDIAHTAAVGGYFIPEENTSYAVITEAVSIAAGYFEAENIRNVISEIYIENDINLRLVMCEGLSVIIQNYKELFTEKITRAFDFYTDASLAQEKKADPNGRIIAHKMGNEIWAVYSNN